MSSLFSYAMMVLSRNSNFSGVISHSNFACDDCDTWGQGLEIGVKLKV